MRFGGRELMVASHSRSPRPMRPILIPLVVVIMWVGFALPRGTLSPRAGSRMLARSHGKWHLEARLRNCLTPKSRSWFWVSVSIRGRLKPSRQRGGWSYPDARGVRSDHVEEGDHVASWASLISSGVKRFCYIGG